MIAYSILSDSLQQEDVKAKEALVKSQKDAIGQKDKEIQQITSQKEKITKRINDEELNLKSLTNYIEGCMKDVEKNDQMVWILLVLVALTRPRISHEKW